MPRNTLPLLMVCLCNLAFAQTNINFDSLQRLVDKDPQRTVAYLDSVEATLRKTDPVLPALYVMRGLATGGKASTATPSIITTKR